MVTGYNNSFDYHPSHNMGEIMWKMSELLGVKFVIPNYDPIMA